MSSISVSRVKFNVEFTRQAVNFCIKSIVIGSHTNDIGMWVRKYLNFSGDHWFARKIGDGRNATFMSSSGTLLNGHSRMSYQPCKVAIYLYLHLVKSVKIRIKTI